MAITEVQQKDRALATASSFAIVFDAAPTAGNLLVGLYCTGAGGSNPGAITNPTGWSTAFTLQRSTGQRVICVYKVAAGGESATVTIQSAGNVGWIGSIFEISGLVADTATVLDQATTNDGGTGGLTTLASGTTGTTTVANEYVIAAWGLAAASGGTESVSGYTIEDTSNDKVIIASKIVAATGAQAATAVWTTSRTVVAGIATFKGLAAVGRTQAVVVG